jgi:hypothetical protein
MPEEHLGERELPSGEVGADASHLDPPREQVEGGRAHVKHGLLGSTLAAEADADAREQLLEAEGRAGLPLRGDSRQMLWQNGGTGGFRSFVGFVKESETAVAVLSNCSRSVDPIGFRILQASSEGFIGRR